MNFFIKKPIVLAQALPKGHLQEAVGGIYDRTGFAYPGSSRPTSYQVDNAKIASTRFWAHDVAENMSKLSYDLGVTGRDFYVEHYLLKCKEDGTDPLQADNPNKQEFVELLDFERKPSKMVWVVRKNGFRHPVSVDDLKKKYHKGLTTASEFPQITDYCMEMLGLKVIDNYPNFSRPHKSRYFRGEEESHLPSSNGNGYNCVSLIAETGGSIKEKGDILLVEAPLLHSTPRLSARRDSYERYTEEIDKYVARLKDAMGDETDKDRFDWAISPRGEGVFMKIRGDLSLNELMEGLYKSNPAGYKHAQSPIKRAIAAMASVLP